MEKNKILAKIITQIEGNPEKLDDFLVSNKENKISKIIGFTGSPGSGKSTLISSITEFLRNQNKKVAILAIDPKSPLSRGAFFGDRIRMQKHYLDSNVFIRSISGNTKSGVNPAVPSISKVFEASGFDYILIESVGTGQSEIDLSFFVDVLVLVLSPGDGDDVQFLKAGILEVADIYAVNKADTAGYDKFFNLLKSQPIFDKGKLLVRVSGISSEGIPGLCKIIDELWRKFFEEGKLTKKRKKALLKQAELFLIDKLEEIINSENIMNFNSLKEAKDFLISQILESGRDNV